MKLRFECDIVEIARAGGGYLPIVRDVKSNVYDLDKLAELLALVSSEVELARVQARSLADGRGQVPIVRLPGSA